MVSYQHKLFYIRNYYNKYKRAEPKSEFTEGLPLCNERNSCNKRNFLEDETRPLFGFSLKVECETNRTNIHNIWIKTFNLNFCFSIL